MQFLIGNVSLVTMQDTTLDGYIGINYQMKRSLEVINRFSQYRDGDRRCLSHQHQHQHDKNADDRTVTPSDDRFDQTHYMHGDCYMSSKTDPHMPNASAVHGLVSLPFKTIANFHPVM